MRSDIYTSAWRLARSIGIGVSAVVLASIHAVTALFLAISLIDQPSGIGDTNYIDGAFFTAFYASAFAVVAAILTTPIVLVGWLNKRWLLIPLVLFVVATSRWIYIGNVYPGPAD